MSTNTISPPAHAGRQLPAFLDGGLKKLLIDGKLVEAASGQVFETFHPGDGKALAKVSLGGEVDIDLAVASARKALNGSWRHAKPADRQMILLRLADLVEKHFDELATLDVLDVGVPFQVYQGRKARILYTIRYFAALAIGIHGKTIQNSLAGDVFSYTLKEPIGVVGAIIPWNFPLYSAIWKCAPAIAAGCTVVLKAADLAPLSSLRLGELALEAGLPPGVFNVVAGKGDAGAALANHPGVDKITFTGSTAVGQEIIRASAKNVKRVTLELGGKSANIVFADADLDAAVSTAAMAAFANSGQICCAGTRLFVEKSIYPEFIERVAAFTKTLRVGDPFASDTQIGPLISRSQLDRVNGYIAAGREQGATAVAGGHWPDNANVSSDGYYVAPTVFANVTDDMTIAREEIFGPVVSALSFESVDEVILRANTSEYGLGGGVWTSNLSKAHKVSKEIQTGNIWVNCYTQMDTAIPFGGYKMSGYGKEGGDEHIEAFLNQKSVVIKVS